MKGDLRSKEAVVKWKMVDHGSALDKIAQLCYILKSHFEVGRMQ